MARAKTPRSPGGPPRRQQLSALDEQLRALGIDPDELEEQFIRARGPGGQHVNKTSTAVRIKHPPSGLEARAESERSQLANRIEARRLLVAQIEEAIAAEAARRQQAREKARRQRRQPSRRAKARTVEGKRRRGAIKRQRGKVDRGDD